MQIRPGTRLQIGPHEIEVRMILEIDTLDDAVCIEIEDTNDRQWGVYFFRDGRIQGRKHYEFGGEMMPVGQCRSVSRPLIDTSTKLGSPGA